MRTHCDAVRIGDGCELVLVLERQGRLLEYKKYLLDRREAAKSGLLAGEKTINP